MVASELSLPRTTEQQLTEKMDIRML